MNFSQGLGNKLIYLAVLILMLFPLFLLGQPSGGGGESGGGQLTQMRDEFQISEADLGEINPASETMKLSTLGLRGIAASLLWNKAHEHKVHHEWDRLRATLNNIALLQPHFEKVWEFQAHNMAYNVSSEFDDYRQRYEWVVGGTEYLVEGVRQNRKSPVLLWHTGWYYGNKIGVADEKRQFRRLFADDTSYHARIRAEGIDIDGSESLGPDRKPDNWLVGRQWFNRGYRLTREGGVPLRRKTPLHYYETGPKWLINHAVAIEEEGEFGDAAQRAWQRGYSGWLAYGDELIPTTEEFSIRLRTLDEMRRRMEDLQSEFDELTDSLRVQMRDERIAQLSEEQREALETPVAERTQRQYELAGIANLSINPSGMEVARRAPPDIKIRAMELANELEQTRRRLTKVQGYRDQVNYDYWETRTQAEQTPLMIEARTLVYEADRLNEDAELDQAIEKYELAWGKWAEVFEQFPVLMYDVAAEDLKDSLKRYQRAIDSEEFPENFPLRTFADYLFSDAVSPEEYEEMVQQQSQAERPGKQNVVELDFQQMIREASGAVSQAQEEPVADPEKSLDTQAEVADDVSVEKE